VTATPALSVAMAPHTAGARAVLLTLVARYEMQCGWPGRGAVVVRLPAGMQLPATFAPRSAIVNGKPVTPSIANRAQRAVSLDLLARPQVMCDSIAPGTLTITFTHGAKLGAPRAAGVYTIVAAHGADRFAGKLTVTR
jgi:hypothetical protein